ncbi:MAG: isopenicillin N synthase family oxygenase [Myxococcaceae bacterium]|nr:isopenicillin N synthase family oxygenase [Myxococcaceae bacterium]
MSDLPIIDVASPDAPARLRAACESLGFFYVTNHGVDAELERRLEQLTPKLFALPRPALERIAMKHGGRAWRGWFPVGGELTSGQPDAKEGVYFGRELPPSPLPLHGPNLFPAELPELEPVVIEWMRQVERAGQRVLEGLARSLELRADFFARSLTRDPLPLFRIFHYPASSEGWGVGEHTDYGLLTLLKQDDCGGLEVKTPNGWAHAEPIPGTFVCNLGDMLDRITGGRYRSTPHRVRNRAGRSRYSWPFFLDPSFDAEVAPLPGARVRPAEVDAAERWDKASVHSLSGTYGQYLVGKVSKVFPELVGNLAP